MSRYIGGISGTFYSLGLMSAIDHFVKGEIWYPLWHSPVLISIEVSFILLTSLELGLKFGGIEVRSKKKDDTPVQKYAGYLCNMHLSESEEVKDEWEGTAKGMYLRTWFGYTEVICHAH